MDLNGHDHIGAGNQGIESQQADGRRTIDHAIIVFIADHFELLGQNEFFARQAREFLFGLRE